MPEGWRDDAAADQRRGRPAGADRGVARAGYSEALLRKLAHDNWLNLLQRTWGE